MPRLFWKCDCGIEWQAVQSEDRRITIYGCICGRRRTFRGKAVGLYYAPVITSCIRPSVWKEVSAEKFEIDN
jgi:hypothetical protein